MKRYISKITDIIKSKKEYQEDLLHSTFEQKLKALIRIQDKAVFFDKIRYKFSESFQIGKVIKALDDLKSKKLIKDYVIGGATALLYYSTPALTEDIDIFITVNQSSLLIDLSEIYNYLKKEYKAYEKNEYIFVYDTPLQFLVPGDKLTQEAFDNSETITVQGKKFKIFSLEYIIALMVWLGKPKYRERIRLVKEENKFDSDKLYKILKKYNLVEKWETKY